MKFDKIQIEKSTSYLDKGPLTNDKNRRKNRQVSIIPFPVCEYAAIHYKDGRRLEELHTRKTTNNKIKLIETKKKDK